MLCTLESICIVQTYIRKWEKWENIPGIFSNNELYLMSDPTQDLTHFSPGSHFYTP